MTMSRWRTNVRTCLSLWLAIAFLPAKVSAQQVPLTASVPYQQYLDFTSAAPHVFSSLRYLLDQWPNTYIPNGHSIVPCEVPAFTNLYHGRRDEKLPSSPEWLAFDAEMSYGIMGSSRNSHLLTYQNMRPAHCLYFDGMSAALMGTGPLDSQMVFLCGNTTCSQGRNETWRGLLDEYSRATALCDWVQKNKLGSLGWGIEGIVRMNAGFEMIWCNFTSPTLRLVSHVNVSVPLLPEGFRDDGPVDEMAPMEGPLTSSLTFAEMLASRTRPASTSISGPASEIPTGEPDMPLPPNWRSKAELEPFLQSQSFEWYRSATWHMGSSDSSMGRPEGRVRLKFCGFLSYYDSMLKEFSSVFAQEEKARLNLTADGSWKGPGRDGNYSLALKELSARRRSHNLSQITNDEASIMTNAVLHTLRSLNHSSSSCTGIDWTQKATDITSRFSQPLNQVLRLLTSPPTDTTNTTLTRDYIASLRSKSHAMLMPYMTYPLIVSSLPAIHALCTTGQTSVLHPLRPSLLPTEQSLLDTFETVLSAICNTTLSLAFSVEQTWQTYYQHNNNSNGSTSMIPTVPHSVLHTLVAHHSASISLLRAWLGWFPDEMQCDRVCRVDEFCFIPIWPLLYLEPRSGRPGGRRPPHRPAARGGGQQPPPRRGRGNPWGDLESELWKPRCLKLLD
ncbi:uncharacterized protein Z519_12205 [Cladophialophora bantiana CBS 173.52]|uniref:Uncharacterized protein n=1 Tax=Cladophialophora bantiana (strain ATCC 10958 / CBS 173.52 / CDC B-1940 / NIH 8579) TaxID=1442370 RepID=A0A0D2HRT8_CLAB1|nr:uncharacterized protein Z519_12205 [Cladophialophora bantiana CBS 173.52]KIW87094.1 hypothetical protein Z519_12205 [Cladophialophora bantiana CBS 173.52]